jgi:hypothetical protein
METREPMKRGKGRSKEDREMGLPDGKTCGDCAHCRRCCLIFGHTPEDEVCDWYPSRFLHTTFGIDQTTKGEPCK